MKDCVHHLKHIQKKVIQSARKAQALEDNVEPAAIAPPMETEVSSVHKKKYYDTHLRKSLIRLHVH